MSAEPAIRVLVAEDSSTARALLVGILRAEPDVRVAGEARNGVEAVEMTKRLRPDVVTMDVRMPGMDGFEATRRIMVEAPTPIVIVSASLDVRDVEVSLHALRAGALAVLPKPEGPGSPGFETTGREFVRMVKAMSQVKVVRRWPERPSSGPGPAGRPDGDGAPIRVVAVAASTGGPAALQRVLSGLPGDFAPPILVVQHIAKGFVQGLAAWLNGASPLRVTIAGEGEPLRASTVYLAPDDRHLAVADRGTVRIEAGEPRGGFRPSANVLFETVGKAYGASAVGVVLTGMGQDGVEGLAALRASGGRVLAQDEATSVVYGMPRAAVEAGLAGAVLPLDAIAPRLVAMV